MTRMCVLKAGKVDLAGLYELARRPEPFPTRDENFWTEPYIAGQMLAYHLSPRSDAASRKPETIARSVDWIAARLNLPAKAEVLDLGCGPGLYAERLARKGLRVTGIDFSENSIAFARRRALEDGQAIDYRVQDYLTLQERDRFDAALLIYYDLGPLTDTQRDDLLGRVWLALKPGGAFVFDVMTGLARPPHDMPNTWNLCPGSGFWRPGPYLELNQSFHFPDQHIWVDRYIILEESGQVTLYQNWDHYYSPHTIRPVLERAGFVIENIYQDLTGSDYNQDSPSLAVVARKS